MNDKIVRFPEISTIIKDVLRMLELNIKKKVPDEDSLLFQLNDYFGNYSEEIKENEDLIVQLIKKAIKKYKMIVNEVELGSIDEKQLFHIMINKLLIPCLVLTISYLEYMGIISITNYQNELWFLPVKDNDTIKYPLRRFFEWWKETAFDNWDSLKEEISNVKVITSDSAKRELERWVYENKTPNIYTINQLSNIKTEQSINFSTNIDDNFLKIIDFINQENISPTGLGKELIFSDIKINALLTNKKYPLREQDKIIFVNKYMNRFNVNDENKIILKLLLSKLLNEMIKNKKISIDEEEILQYSNIISSLYRKISTYYLNSTLDEDMIKAIKKDSFIISDFKETLVYILSGNNKSIIGTIENQIYRKCFDFNDLAIIKQVEELINNNNLIKVYNLWKNIDESRIRFETGCMIAEYICQPNTVKLDVSQEIFEKIINVIEGLTPYNKFYNYRIQFYKGRYNIQLCKFGRALKHYQKALVQGLNRAGNYQKRIIKEACFLTGYIAYIDKKISYITKFKRFYEEGYKKQFYNEPWGQVKDFIIRDMRKNFLDVFKPNCFFNSVPDEKIKELQDVRLLGVFSLEELEKERFRHSNHKKKGYIQKPITLLDKELCQGNIEKVKALIRGDFDINLIMKNEDNSTPLIHVLQAVNIPVQERKEIIKLILDQNIKKDIINARTYKYRITALSIAIQCGFTDIVKNLIDKGADVNQRAGFDIKRPPLIKHFDVEFEYKNNTPLYLAIINLVPHNYNIHKEYYNPDIKEDDLLEIIKCLINIPDIDLNKKNLNGFTALMLACELRLYGVVEQLVNAGANCEVKNDGGYTALDIAEYINDSRLIKLLP
ncbi:MAG: ankyrin repeat domain-containing protein [Halanaerobiales bacterium]